MSKEKDRVTYSEQRTTVDYSSGEVTVSENVTLVKKGVEPNYIKLYVDTLLTFKELPKTLSPTLIAFLKHMTYAEPSNEDGGQLIYVNAHMKKTIASELNVKLNTVDQTLTRLTKVGVFKRIGTGTYQVNPHLFGKGEWKNISAIRATFDFNTGDVQAVITKTTDETEEETTPTETE